jgi:hypothetical protein
MGCLARLRWVPPAPSRAVAWWLVRWRCTVAACGASNSLDTCCSEKALRALLGRAPATFASSPESCDSLQTTARGQGLPPRFRGVTVCLLHPISEGQPGALCILKIAEAVHLARSLDNTPSRQLPSSSIACKSPVVCTASTARLRPSCPSAHAYLVCPGQNLQCCRLTHACMLWQDRWRSWTASGRTDLP